jgi:subtilisin family serine protease
MKFIRYIILLAGLFVLFAPRIWAEGHVPSTYWVKLRDKAGSRYSVNHPEQFLSGRAIERRNRYRIAIDESDLPVSDIYLDSLKRLGLQVVHTSKWLNAVTVKSADSLLIDTISCLDFVDTVLLSKPALPLKSAFNKFETDFGPAAIDTGYYGSAVYQVGQLNGQALHDRGYRGKGIRIAVLDAGFYKVDQFEAFDSLWVNGQILGIKDFVDPAADFYTQNYHGMSVLSTMGGNWPGKLIGTAPDASYYLFRTEDVATEYPVEMDNWIAAAELADSLGVDVINSSLGYFVFDDTAMSYSYKDMNGQTTRVAKAAGMAFEKGILVVASAGNEANNAWKYIVSPADADEVIAVAAVSKDGARASFSSVGPAYGGNIKPNVAAMGYWTALVTSSGILGAASGTSFSSPVLAGLAACLIQAMPEAGPTAIKYAIEQSSDHAARPDSLTGYGIPNFEKAFEILKSGESTNTARSGEWSVFPNPFSVEIVIRGAANNQSGSKQLYLYNTTGACVLSREFSGGSDYVLRNLTKLPDGFYFLKIVSGQVVFTDKLVKAGR